MFAVGVVIAVGALPRLRRQVAAVAVGICFVVVADTTIFLIIAFPRPGKRFSQTIQRGHAWVSDTFYSDTNFFEIGFYRNKYGVSLTEWAKCIVEIAGFTLW